MTDKPTPKVDHLRVMREARYAQNKREAKDRAEVVKEKKKRRKPKPEEE